jgi:hypothetical protein
MNALAETLLTAIAPCVESEPLPRGLALEARSEPALLPEEDPRRPDRHDDRAGEGK